MSSMMRAPAVGMHHFGQDNWLSSITHKQRRARTTRAVILNQPKESHGCCKSFTE